MEIKLKLVVANIGIDKKWENGKIVPLTRAEHYTAFKNMSNKRYEMICEQFNNHLLLLSEAPHVDTALIKKYNKSEKYFVVKDLTCNADFPNALKINPINTNSHHYMHVLVNVGYRLNILNVHRQSNHSISLLDDLKAYIEQKKRTTDGYYGYEQDEVWRDPDEQDEVWQDDQEHDEDEHDEDGHDQGSDDDQWNDDEQHSNGSHDDEQHSNGSNDDEQHGNGSNDDEQDDDEMTIIAGDFNIHDDSFQEIKTYLESQGFTELDTSIIYIGMSVHDSGYHKRKHMRVFHKLSHFKISIDPAYLRENVSISVSSHVAIPLKMVPVVTGILNPVFSQAFKEHQTRKRNEYIKMIDYVFSDERDDVLAEFELDPNNKTTGKTKIKIKKKIKKKTKINSNSHSNNNLSIMTGAKNNPCTARCQCQKTDQEKCQAINRKLNYETDQSNKKSIDHVNIKMELNMTMLNNRLLDKLVAKYNDIKKITRHIQDGGGSVLKATEYRINKTVPRETLYTMNCMMIHIIDRCDSDLVICKTMNSVIARKKTFMRINLINLQKCHTLSRQANSSVRTDHDQNKIIDTSNQIIAILDSSKLKLKLLSETINQSQDELKRYIKSKRIFKNHIPDDFQAQLDNIIELDRQFIELYMKCDKIAANTDTNNKVTVDPKNSYIKQMFINKIKENEHDELLAFTMNMCDHMVDATMIDDQIKTLDKMSNERQNLNYRVARTIQNDGKYDELLSAKRKIAAKIKKCINT
jgi:hypothetical protein